MKIIRAKDYYDMSRKAANIISAQVIMKPNCVLGLATGGTPVGTYKQLVEWYNKGDLDFAEVNTVNLDEYRGLPREHPESYWSFMHRNLFDLVNIRPEAIHMPAGTNMDAAAECSHYDEIIQHLGGVDLQLLGIGHDGHIGFNEPGAAFELGTHCVHLTKETIEANKRFFDNNEDLVPKEAYTMGIKTIMQALARLTSLRKLSSAPSRRKFPLLSCRCTRISPWCWMPKLLPSWTKRIAQALTA